MGRVGLAFRCFFRVLGGKPVPEEALPKEEPPPALPPKSDIEEHARAVQILGLLQKEGRLIDFLQEEIADYDDEQIGAAVRNIHRDCRGVLGEQMTLEPVLKDEEDSEVTIEAGFDPSAVRLIGNVTGEPPFKGVLRHRGWKASAVRLPDFVEGGDKSIVAPAEVELS